MEQQQEHGREPTDVVPWEGAADAAEMAGERHDAFNGARKRVFLKALAKSGCVSDAARKAGITPQTVYNHRTRDPEFARHIDLALGMAASDVELVAWERGVVGIEEDVIAYGKVVGTRRKRSDSILRLLLQGANRKKYGPRPGFGRNRMLRHERKQIEREVRAEIAAERDGRSSGELLEEIETMLEQARGGRRAAGWIEAEPGVFTPPGRVRAGDGGRNPHDPAPGVPEVGDSV